MPSASCWSSCSISSGSVYSSCCSSPVSTSSQSSGGTSSLGMAAIIAYIRKVASAASCTVLVASNTRRAMSVICFACSTYSRGAGMESYCCRLRRTRNSTNASRTGKLSMSGLPLWESAWTTEYAARMPGYSCLTRKSNRPSSTTVKISSDSLRSSNRLKKRCMSVIQARSKPSPSTCSSPSGRSFSTLFFSRSARRSWKMVEGSSNSK